MEIPRNELEMKGPYPFHYRRVKLLDESAMVERATALSPRHARARVERWNTMDVARWRYELLTQEGN